MNQFKFMGNMKILKVKQSFLIENGRIVKIVIKSVKGVSPLKGSKLKNFEDFIKEYRDMIIDKWIDYFVLHKEVDFERYRKEVEMKIVVEHDQNIEKK
jgi:hypothetical protein